MNIKRLPHYEVFAFAILFILLLQHYVKVDQMILIMIVSTLLVCIGLYMIWPIQIKAPAVDSELQAFLTDRFRGSSTICDRINQKNLSEGFFMTVDNGPRDLRKLEEAIVFFFGNKGMRPVISNLKHKTLFFAEYTVSEESGQKFKLKMYPQELDFSGHWTIEFLP